jgi:hypothetical protein
MITVDRTISGNPAVKAHSVRLISLSLIAAAGVALLGFSAWVVGTSEGQKARGPQMARRKNVSRAQAAWEHIEALGGHGVCEPDMVVVSLSGTAIRDDDLALFREFPFVQILGWCLSSVE